MKMLPTVIIVKSVIGVSLVLAVVSYQFMFEYSSKYYIYVFLVFSFLYILIVGHIRKKSFQQFEKYQFLTSVDILHLLSIIFTGLAWILAFSAHFEESFQDNSAYYILSSISQGLAALFALIFSLSLITAQISTKHSFHLIGKFFGMPTRLFMVLFAIGVLLPLYALKTSSLLLLDASLGLCGTNIILLFPYLAYLRNQIDPSHFLKELSEKAIEKLSTLGSSPEEYPREFSKMDNYFKEIYSIDSTILRAHRESDYDTFITGIKSLLEIGTSERVTNERAIKEVFVRLYWIGSETAYYRDTIFQIGLLLGNAAIKAIESGKEFLAYGAIYSLGGFIEKALCKAVDEKVEKIVWGLGDATSEAIRTKMKKPSDKGISFLEGIGKKAAVQDCEYSLIQLLEYLPLMDPRILKPDPGRNDLICKCWRIKEEIVESAFEHLTNKKRIGYIMDRIVNDRKRFWGTKEVRKELIKFYCNLGAYLRESPDDVFKEGNLKKIRRFLSMIDPEERKQAFEELLTPDKRGLLIPEKRVQNLKELRGEIEKVDNSGKKLKKE